MKLKSTILIVTICESVQNRQKNEFQLMWHFDQNCQNMRSVEFGAWHEYRGKGMHCGLCRTTNTLQSSNNSNVWNSAV